MANQKEVKSSSLVKARVRPNNAYDKFPAGSVIEVEASEIARVPHCLVSLEQELAEEAEIKARADAAVKPGAAEQEFDRAKTAQLAALEASKRAAALRLEAVADDNKKRAGRLTGTKE